MKKVFLAALSALPFVAAADLCDYVDPFVGTAGTGHTFPGACVPFGLIQAGPDTGNGDWDHCSGYVYGDTNLYGFSQTHLNGTGCADLGDIRLLPFTSDEVPEFLPMDKATEKASPGYYTVTAGGVKTEVTATEHAACYRFTFPKGTKRRLLVDTQWGLRSWGEATNRVLAADVAVTNNAIVGTLDVRQWNSRHVAFVVQPDRRCSDFSSVVELPRRPGEKAPRFVVEFADDEDSASVLVALSVNSVEAAWKNIRVCRCRHPLFNCYLIWARRAWESELSRATIEGSDEQKRNWYTSLYHLCVQPNVISDDARGWPMPTPVYSTFSTWDTFRAAGPLYTILMPEKAAEFVDSMLKQGEKTGYLPIWTLWGEENQCMIGTHSVPMIVDWFLKEGLGGRSRTTKEFTSTVDLDLRPRPKFYWESAYAQIKDTLTKRHDGRGHEQWDLYDRYGYYPFDKVNGESVSRTLECAYDDWCAAQMAKKLGKDGDYAFFMKRAGYWKNLFDPSIGLMRSKDSKGAWKCPYDPYKMGYNGVSDFTEGNAFQYTWHVMQDPEGLVAAMGGREKFLAQLDRLFTMKAGGAESGSVLDVTGLIGQYVHGNEPSHHVIYFYSLLGERNRAAERIREVFDRFYLPKPDGLCGNDDCGQMSAWYLFSAMGFYPFNPCGGDFVVGAPQVPKVTIRIPTQTPKQPNSPNTFTILAKNLSKENKYVKSVTLNGKPLAGPVLKYAEIMAGGELVFEMGGAEK